MLDLLYKVLVFAALHGSVVEAGYAPHYSAGLMARVAANRDMPPAACMVSRPRGPIGGWVWVYGQWTGTLLHCKIVDVSGPADVRRHEQQRRVTELSFEVAATICGSTRERVIDCPVIVIGD